MTDATKKDLERFIKELETLDVDDLPDGDFQGKTLDVVQWGVYQRIVKLLEDLPDKCDNILTLDYLEAPHPADKMATITVSLIVTKGKDKTRYRIAAMPQEINNILFPFFFQDKGKNSYPTNWDCGLTHYWLGHYQSSYIHWRRFVVEGHGVDDLIRQLPIQSLHGLAEYVNGYKESA